MLTKDWGESWSDWKSISFAKLQTEDMGMQAQGMLKKLAKVAREVKVGWPVWSPW